MKKTFLTSALLVLALFFSVSAATAGSAAATGVNCPACGYEFSVHDSPGN